MTYETDLGTCCIVVPAKPGVALIALYTVVTALLSIFALFTGDIRFQATGYDVSYYYYSPIVGAFGFFFGFIGLFAAYDDVPRGLRMFVYYLAVKLIVLIWTSIADWRMLGQCTTWLAGITAAQAKANPALFIIASSGSCSVARMSYLLGAFTDVMFNLYLWYTVRCYQQMMEMRNGKAISFREQEEYDVTKHWKLYKVKDPRLNYFAKTHQGKTEEEKKAEAEAKAKEEAEALRPGPGFIAGFGYGAASASIGKNTRAKAEENVVDAEEGPPHSVKLANLVGAHQTADAM